MNPSRSSPASPTTRSPSTIFSLRSRALGGSSITALVFVLADRLLRPLSRAARRIRGGRPAPAANWRSAGPRQPFFLFLFIFWWAAGSQLAGAARRRRTRSKSTSSPSSGCGRCSSRTACARSTKSMLPIGTPVRLVMTSQDVIHSLFLPALRIKQDVLPDRYTYLWFTASKPGIYHLLCARILRHRSFAHDRPLVLMPPADYARWMRGAAAGGRPCRARASSCSARSAARAAMAPIRACTRPTSMASTAAPCTSPTAAR